VNRPSTQPTKPATLSKTLLNRVRPVKGFVYDKVELAPDAGQPHEVHLAVSMRPRRRRRLEPIKRVAQSLRQHRELFL